MRVWSIPRSLAISRFEKSESVITREARRAPTRVSVRRRNPSRQENHSGWAAKDTSWIVTTVETRHHRGHV
jgi:hypothetical protein